MREENDHMKKHEFEDAKLLWKLFYAGQCFTHVQAAAEYVHTNQLAEDSPVFYPLVTAVYVLYGKPFKISRGIDSLGEEIVPSEYRELHGNLITHRDKLYAHSDADAFEWPDVGQVNQVRVERLQTEIIWKCSQLQAKATLMPHIIKLCLCLRQAIESRKSKLCIKYKKSVPMKLGEYILNIDDVGNEFLKPAKPVFVTK